MLVVGAESVEMGAGVFVDADGLDRSAFDEQTEPVAVESDGASPRDQTRSNFHTVWQAPGISLARRSLTLRREKCPSKAFPEPAYTPTRGGTRGMSEIPLRVNPAELLASAGKLDDRARTFSTAHQAAHSQAGGVSLGSGTAAAALPAMLAAWDERGAAFGTHFANHSAGHRDAAASYESTDENGGRDISQWV